MWLDSPQFLRWLTSANLECSTYQNRTGCSCRNKRLYASKREVACGKFCLWNFEVFSFSLQLPKGTISYVSCQCQINVEQNWLPLQLSPLVARDSNKKLSQHNNVNSINIKCIVTKRLRKCTKFHQTFVPVFHPLQSKDN